MATVQVRYIVHDVVMYPAPPFAMLTRNDLRLVLSASNPSGGGGQPMPDGTRRLTVKYSS